MTETTVACHAGWAGSMAPYYAGSGTAAAYAVCFGRIAGQNAAAEEPWE